MGNCAGIDWASEKHEVLIEDPAGAELLAETFAHDEDGVSALCAALACFDVELVAIEPWSRALFRSGLPFSASARRFLKKTSVSIRSRHWARCASSSLQRTHRTRLSRMK